MYLQARKTSLTARPTDRDRRLTLMRTCLTTLSFLLVATGATGPVYQQQTVNPRAQHLVKLEAWGEEWRNRLFTAMKRAHSLTESGLLIEQGSTTVVSPDCLRSDNEENVKSMLDLINSDGWKHIVTSKGQPQVSVWAKSVAPGTLFTKGAANDVKAAKFKAIKATAILNSPPKSIFALFRDISRVHEYNDFCADFQDVQVLDESTKITWSLSRSIGPLKARDFVTIVHYREFDDGRLLVVNRPIHHPSKKPTTRYQRGEVLLAGNLIEPHPSDTSKSKVTIIAQINPGGIVDNKVGAAIANKVAATGPAKYLKKLEAASQHSGRIRA